MNNDRQNRVTLESLATILGGTFLFNLAVMLLWFCAITFVPDLFYRINQNWFGINRHEIELINYSGIAFLKIINFAFFLFPYLTIKIMLRKKRLND
jgi:hypothetical protein